MRQCLLLIIFLLNAASGVRAQQFKYSRSTETVNNDAGPIQIGLKASYLMPRNEFGMDFKRSPGYELYVQFRDANGDGRWSARLGLFYADLKPRLDTIPSYMVQEYPTKVFPGYIVHKKLDFIGLCLEYAYSVVRVRDFRLDLGLGFMVGQYHQEYEEGYATIITTNASIDSRFVALRPRMTVGYQLNRYLEVYTEAMDVFLTNIDWSSQFHHTSLSLGLNVSLKPSKNEN